VIHGTLSFAKLFLVFSYIGWIYFPLATMIGRFNDIVRNITSVEKMYEEFSQIEGEDLQSGKVLKKVSGDISFREVSFGYLKEKKILKNISFQIPA